MKKIMSVMLALLLCGCTPVTESKEHEFVYAAAEYCFDDECSRKVKVKYNEDEISEIASYIDSLPEISKPLDKGEEKVKLVLIDSQGLQYTFTEEVAHSSEGTVYFINDVMKNTTYTINEKDRLTHVIDSLKGETLPESEALGYSVGEDFFVVSYSGYLISENDGNDYLRNRYAGEPAFSMLFYIDESFADASQIKDQKRLLTGVMNQLEFPYHYEPDAEEYEDKLLYSASGIDETSVLNKGRELINNFDLPQLSSSMLGVSGFSKYYYDNEQRLFIKQINQNHPVKYTQFTDMILMPVYIDGLHMRLVKVRVHNTNYTAVPNIQSAKPVAEGTYYKPYYDYGDLFNDIVNHLDQFDLYDVEVDEQQRIKAVEIKQRAKQNEGEGIDGSDFILNVNDTNSIYTYRSIEEQASIYNSFMRNVNSDVFETDLSENQDFISMTITVGDTKNFQQKHILIDKKDGFILDDGMLNERYFDGQLEAKILKQLANQNLEACALAYEDNLSTPKCYVKPMIADVYDPNHLVMSFSSFIINDEGQLVLPVFIREYGGYSGIIEIIP